MILKVKKLHKDAKLPWKAYKGDACFDLFAVEDTLVEGNGITKVRFGIAWEMPEGYEGVLRPRSSSYINKNLHVYIGTIDQQYRGEVICAVSLIAPSETKYYGLDGKFVPKGEGIHKLIMPKPYLIKKGEAVAQVAFRKVPMFWIREVDELSETDRGEKGFGSSG